MFIRTLFERGKIGWDESLGLDIRIVRSSGSPWLFIGLLIGGGGYVDP